MLADQKAGGQTEEENRDWNVGGAESFGGGLRASHRQRGMAGRWTLRFVVPAGAGAEGGLQLALDPPAIVAAAAAVPDSQGCAAPPTLDYAFHASLTAGINIISTRNAWSHCIERYALVPGPLIDSWVM
ncbi:hypothetical protein SCAR479_06615 [Seiridium cardinale]|uniref:Uncharacterized protein n=1 Tax=Seiridium cardinale TaxID=138064 RepID=A0ABR2XSW3_9PEZI